jgi:hypothetical protein
MDFEFYTTDLLTDIEEYIDENINYADYDDIDELRDYLNDELWANDSVTGNGPNGGYYSSTADAREQFFSDGFDNFDSVVSELSIPHEDVIKHFLEGDWDWFDTNVRCYLLSECIDSVLDDIEADFLASKDENYEAGVETSDEDYDEGFEESYRRGR